MEKTTPFCLLLLPGTLEQLPFRSRGEDLLRSPAVAAVEPGRVGPRSSEMLAVMQARRLSKRLPGIPAVAVILDPAQYPLARALIARHRDCELWYGSPPAADIAGQELRDLHDLAVQRATLRFDPAPPGQDQGAHQANEALWDRLEELNIARR